MRGGDATMEPEVDVAAFLLSILPLIGLALLLVVGLVIVIRIVRRRAPHRPPGPNRSRR